jgi:hypothetical protein
MKRAAAISRKFGVAVWAGRLMPNQVPLGCKSH